MAAVSDYLEVQLLNHSLGGAVFVQPASVYAALFTTTTTDAGGGTEVAGSGYSRQLVTWNAAATGQIDSAADVNFTAVGGIWGTVTHVAFYDAATAGNSLYHGALTAPKIVNDGDTLKFTAGQFIITLD